jgi:hypothetical protein
MAERHEKTKVLHQKNDCPGKSKHVKVLEEQDEIIKRKSFLLSI